MRGTCAHCDRSVPLRGLHTLWLALGTHGPFYPPKKPTRISKHCSRQLTRRHVVCTPARSCAMPPPPGWDGEGHVRDSSLQGCVWHSLSRAPALPHGMSCVLLLLWEDHAVPLCSSFLEVIVRAHGSMGPLPALGTTLTLGWWGLVVGCAKSPSPELSTNSKANGSRAWWKYILPWSDVAFTTLVSPVETPFCVSRGLWGHVALLTFSSVTSWFEVRTCLCTAPPAELTACVTALGCNNEPIQV